MPGGRGLLEPRGVHTSSGSRVETRRGEPPTGVFGMRQIPQPPPQLARHGSPARTHELPMLEDHIGTNSLQVVVRKSLVQEPGALVTIEEVQPVEARVMQEALVLFVGLGARQEVKMLTPALSGRALRSMSSSTRRPPRLPGKPTMMKNVDRTPSRASFWRRRESARRKTACASP
jgi:hypothetical protein